MTKKLYSACSSGLCNRLRTLACCDYIARVTGRELIVHWPLRPPGNASAGALWSQLFDNDLRLSRDSDFQELLLTDNSLKCYNCVPSAHEIIFPPDDTEDILIIKQWGTIVRLGGSHPDTEGINLVMGDYFRTLRPASAVRAIVAQYLPSGPFMGLHIRRDTPMGARFDKSTDESFHSHAARYLGQNPRGTIYLASDCQKTKHAFKAYYGDRLVISSLPLGMAGVFETQAALAEIIILSKAEKLVGTYESTYSMVAAHWGGMKYEFA